MTVAFKELAGSPVEYYTPEGFRAERRLLCAWDDRHAVVEQLVGNGYPFGGQSQAAYPGRSDVRASRVRCEPFTDDVVPQDLDELTTGLNRYESFARLTIEYELQESAATQQPAPPVELGTYVSYRQDRDYETVALPVDALTWQTEPTATVRSDDVPAVRIPLIVHRWTWHRVARPPWETIRRCIGTVNQGAFLGIAAGTLLFDGAEAQQQYLRLTSLTDNESNWQVSYVFREKAVKRSDGQIVGWNHAYRPLPADDPGWDELVDANGNRPYRAASFAELFRFGTQAVLGGA